MNFPPGYRFYPIDKELILFYLEKKAKNLPLPWNCSIVERDLYGENATPWNVFSHNDPWDISITRDKDRKKSMKMTLYVFTKLLKFGKKRTERRANCGTWDGQTGAKIIKNCNDIGLCTSTPSALDGVSLNEHTSKDYVICKTTKILTAPRDQPVVRFVDEIGTAMRGGENPRINEELVENCPHANQKQKVEDPLMDDMQEALGSLDPLLPENKDFCFEFPVMGEEVSSDDRFRRLPAVKYDDDFLLFKK
ncbi:NAC transcription factor 29-like [Olea europaea subsp. europaea]|uniref:NAC transcription factor 29-like n=1 Tax=Olea europaea subsp. europaea TaxID=158383 RepID=A0A8S0PXQ4_OLEEU|nr:NAC transcription factor 29-like [Olea europaea subsp. europaea]